MDSKQTENKAGSGDLMEKVEHVSMLFDFYGSLLNESQNEVMSLYHEDNLSLSEIAAELGMTRQAVHYTLKKAEHALEGYEEKLGLLSSYERNRRLAEEAAGLIEEAGVSDSYREKLISIIDRITE